MEIPEDLTLEMPEDLMREMCLPPARSASPSLPSASASSSLPNLQVAAAGTAPFRCAGGDNAFLGPDARRDRRYIQARSIGPTLLAPTECHGEASRVAGGAAYGTDGRRRASCCRRVLAAL